MKARVEAKPLVEAQSRSKVLDYLELTKPRIAGMVLVTALAGYYMGAERPLDLLRVFHMLLGTACVAAGANGMNQVIERRHDALMARTGDRPLPAGRLSVAEAATFSAVFAAAGIIYLGFLTTPLAAILAAATFLLYVLVYTPMKRTTPLNTAIGAAPGALPPLIGWAAARGDVTIPALSIFAILYLWQIPHFLAIAWIYREDYERGGFKMLPVVDPSGSSTARQIVTQGLALICVSLLPTLFHLTGYLYFFSALALGIAFWGFGLLAASRRSIPNARRLVLASVIYLPILLIVMMLDKT